MRLDAILEPGVHHADRLSGVVAEQPVVSAVLVAGHVDASLEQLASTQDVRNVGVEPVEAFIQVGGVVHGPRNTGEIHHRVLVVLPVVTAGLQLGERGQRRIQRQAVVDGAVVGGSGLTSGSPGVHADLAVVEGVGQKIEVHGFGDVACDLRHVVVPAVARSGRVVILGCQVVGVALVALG